MTTMDSCPRTAPELLSLRRGNERCFYCGASCGVEHLASTWVKSSFTARDRVFGGDFVCSGCVVALDEDATITLADGTVRTGQKMRGYSWFLMPGLKIAATKSHLAWLRSLCLAPPDPPYAIIISDSGQKHLIYRGVVCHSEESATVTLEGMRVDYRPPELLERIEVCKRIVAATGKPALKAEPSPATAMRIVAHHGNDAAVRLWQQVREEPLSQLAAWLSPAKEECLHEYPSIA